MCTLTFEKDCFRECLLPAPCFLQTTGKVSVPVVPGLVGQVFATRLQEGSVDRAARSTDSKVRLFSSNLLHRLLRCQEKRTAPGTQQAFRSHRCYHRAKCCEDDVGKEHLSEALTCKEKDQLGAVIGGRALQTEDVTNDQEGSS